MPELQSFLTLVFALLGALLLTAITVKYWSARVTRNWPATKGRVVKADVESRQTKAPGASAENVVHSYPHIVYEYEVNGTTYSADRLNMDAPSPNVDAAGILAHYPVGAEVAVYYDPTRPKQAVLERASATQFARRVLLVLLIFGGAILASAAGLGPVHSLIEQYFPDSPNEDVLVLSSGLGVLVLLFAGFWERDSLVEKRWPVVRGEVLSSSVESFRTRIGRAGHSVQMTMFRPAVVYTYRVDGRQYQSSRIHREQVTSAATTLADNTVARYPVGSPVDVHYNPKNPADAVLETNVFGFFVLILVAGFLLAVAASVSGYMHVGG